MPSEIRKELILEGLGCARCAAEIEDGVSGLEGVSSAYMNFATGTLVIEASEEKLGDVLADTGKIIKNLEPGIIVKEKEAPASAGNALNAGGFTGFAGKAAAARICAGAALFFAALGFGFPADVKLLLYIAAYVLSGGGIVLRALVNAAKGKVFDENFLMALATFGAFAIGQYPEGVAVMLFYQVGEFFQDLAVRRSRKSIAALMDIRPDYANLKDKDGIRRVSPGEIKPGSTIIVKPGEKVPLDGIVTEGGSMLDTSALTGEPVPKDVGVGDTVLSGSINKNGLLTIEVTKEFGESTVSKILDLVQNAGSRKAPTENFITKFARYYTPAVVASATALAFLPPLLIPGEGLAEWVNRALVFLVVSCPCALVISIPLSFFGGIGGASRNGVLIKGSNYLEAMNKVDTVVFDKTGTLTQGVFEVSEINPSGAFSRDELLRFAAFAEGYSTHPIALSILKAHGKAVEKELISDYEEISGFGIKASLQGKQVLAGNGRLMARENVAFTGGAGSAAEAGAGSAAGAGSVVHIAVDGQYAGNIVISDKIKEDSASAIRSLRQMGVRRLVMLTGDSKAAGEKIGRALGLDEVHAELLPGQKVERLEALDAGKPRGGRLMFVGDGINDAPVLARADIGVAMGGLGSDAAIEAADVVLMTDEPSRLVTALRLARKTRNVVLQNIVFAMGIKALVLILGAGGLATMWEAVFADVGVALIAVLNAMRVMRAK